MVKTTQAFLHHAVHFKFGSRPFSRRILHSEPPRDKDLEVSNLEWLQREFNLTKDWRIKCSKQATNSFIDNLDRSVLGTSLGKCYSQQEGSEQDNTDRANHSAIQAKIPIGYAQSLPGNNGVGTIGCPDTIAFASSCTTVYVPPPKGSVEILLGQQMYA